MDQQATVSGVGHSLVEDGTADDVAEHYCVTSRRRRQHDDNVNEGSKSDSPSPPASVCGAGYMSTDSEEAEQFHLLKTLRHYRRGRRHRHHSSSSECSCESCVSHSDDSFFGSDEGPPGGENTVPRRAYMWLENVKINWGFMILGLLVVSVIFTIIFSVVAETGSRPEVGKHILYWTVPLVAVTAGIVIAWRAVRHLLLIRGYGKGDHIMERWNLIQDAQAKELVYSVRGAIYATTRYKTQRRNRLPVYEVVGYESEFDSETYFDSDLETDGQYRRSLTPWRDVDDQLTKERRNIYTRKAWFRDLPVVWWELLLHTRQGV